MPRTELVRFSVPYLQILDQSGTVDAEFEPALSSEQLLYLYRSMKLGREADERMLKLQRQGRIGTFALATGHEAIACGAALAMSETDWFYGSFREPAARMMRGESLAKYMLMHNGYEEGNHDPQSNRLMPFSVIVGAQIPMAVGMAYALRYQEQKDAAVIVVLGDGATSEGDFHEGMNFAGVWQAPVVFLCQNNQWAISVSRQQQTRSETIAQKAIAYGFPGIQVDGNDPLAVYSAVKEALDRAHSGQGPTLIEAVTYRVQMHTTSDDPTRYQHDAEVAAWRERDPLRRMALYLEKKGLLTSAGEEEMTRAVRETVDAAVREFESWTEFKPDAPFDHVFGTTHDVIEEQRAEFLAELAKEADHG